ncbi:putative F-box/LRR-repeat protein 19 [Raphanus sativus]|nr:putative F-box/LRR-repeat protein 19 [Raphanus sativus]
MGSRVLPDWTELTPECLLDIFSRLSIGQRWNGPMLVCKTWTKLCQEPSLNTLLDLEGEFLSSEDSNHWWSSEFEEKVDSTIRSVVDKSNGGLKEIRVRHCTDQSLSYVAERCPNLEVLGATYSPKVTVQSMRKIALNCTKLKELDISCSYLISGYCIELVGTNCKNIHILKRNLMPPSEIRRLKRQCTYVRQRDLCFETLGNADALSILKHMSQPLYYNKYLYAEEFERDQARITKSSNLATKETPVDLY